jgi:dihydropteroate synthase
VNSQQFADWLERKSQPATSVLFEKPLIMGILNLTTDSFSDGGVFLQKEKACEHALHLIAQGADIIDVGGESSKPGARAISLDMELARVIPVIEYIRRNSEVCISIDTYKPEVMQAAVQAGANIINDIYALRQEGALPMAVQLKVPVCLMHMQGQPQDMQKNPSYPYGVMNDIVQFFSTRIAACLQAGVDKRDLILDPGFGFGKRVADNLNLIHHLKKVQQFNLPLLLGVSRKSTIGVLLGKEVEDRLIGGLTFAIYAALEGVGIIRTHDPDETSQALRIIDAISHAG